MCLWECLRGCVTQLSRCPKPRLFPCSNQTSHSWVRINSTTTRLSYVFNTKLIPCVPSLDLQYHIICHIQYHVSYNHMPYHISFITYHIYTYIRYYTMYHLAYIMYHVSYFMHHISYIMYHMPCIIYHSFKSFIIDYLSRIFIYTNIICCTS